MIEVAAADVVEPAHDQGSALAACHGSSSSSANACGNNRAPVIIGREDTGVSTPEVVVVVETGVKAAAGACSESKTLCAADAAATVSTQLWNGTNPEVGAARSGSPREPVTPEEASPGVSSIQSACPNSAASSSNPSG